MGWNLDARVPVLRFPNAPALAAALAADPDAAVLAAGALPEFLAAAGAARETFPPDATHAPACHCCGGRPAAATALDRLFQARLRGTAPWFSRVLALVPDDAARAALDAALRRDAVTLARFRPG